MDHIMPFIWIGISVVMAIIEVATVQLVSIWFVVAAILTAIASATFLSGYLIWQIVLFAVVSVACLLITKPLVSKLKNTRKIKTNSDRYIGKIGKVVVEIGNNTYNGQVAVDGKKWTATSDDNTIINVGETVRIEAIEGVKLIVSPIK